MQKLLQDRNIGKNIQNIRIKCGLSQSDVCIQLELRGRGMVRSTYAHIEQGVRNIFVSDLVLLKEIFNVDYNEFFNGL